MTNWEDLSEPKRAWLLWMLREKLFDMYGQLRAPLMGGWMAEDRIEAIHAALSALDPKP